MFIELVDQLRCAREHEDAWLVASVDRIDGRDIVEGTLGCHVCGARYPVADGVADLRVPEARVPPSYDAVAGDAPDDDALVRLAALLDLTEPGGIVVLVGAWTAWAGALVRLVEGIHVLAVNAAPERREESVSYVRMAGPLTVREASARGAALDRAHASIGEVERAALILRATGRLVAPVGATVPPSCTELARDGEWWVAERTPGLSAPIALRPRRA